MAPVFSRQALLLCSNSCLLRTRFKSYKKKRNKKKKLQSQMLLRVANQQKSLLSGALLSILFLTESTNMAVPRQRSCRRLFRNIGWWEKVWCEYSDRRFKETLRVSRGTFLYILNFVRPDLERKCLNESPLSPEFRLALCLYKLSRGDYYYTIAEMTGVGEATVCVVVIEVCEAIVKAMWNSEVFTHFPKSADDYKESMVTMEEHWQFPCCYGAIDGCHISIKCPPGGQESQKEHHNFKGFYSIVLMAIVDAKFRFIWASCGYTGNNHDSTIFQATKLYEDISNGRRKPSIAKKVNSINVPPMLLGDGAFPFRSWLMKPYSNAVLTREQKYFNYRLSRARMVTEGAFGRLKGRWRVLLKKCECAKSTVKNMTLACIILHNVCIALGDTIPRNLDPNADPASNSMRPRDEVRQMLQMRKCNAVRDTSKQAACIRNALLKLFQAERDNCD